MKNVLSILAFIALNFILPSCTNKDEKINLYGVQTSEASKASSQAYLVFFVILIFLAVALSVFYKKLTKKK